MRHAPQHIYMFSTHPAAAVAACRYVAGGHGLRLVSVRPHGRVNIPRRTGAGPSRRRITSTSPAYEGQRPVLRPLRSLSRVLAQKGSPPSPPPPPPPPLPGDDGKFNIDELFYQRRWPFMLSGIMAAGLGLYISLLTISWFRDVAPCACWEETGNPLEPWKPTGRPREVDEQKDSGGGKESTTASVDDDDDNDDSTRPRPSSSHRSKDPERKSAVDFDRGLDFPEWMLGLRRLRISELAGRARGHVLEVAVGTGRNMPFYDWTEVIAAADDVEAAGQRERERFRRLLDAHSFTGGTGFFGYGSASAGATEEVRRRRLAAARGGAPQPGLLDGEVLTFTGVDISPEMLIVARNRLRNSVPGIKRVMRRRRRLEEPAPGSGGIAVNLLDGRIRLAVADAQGGMPPAPEGEHVRFGLASEASRKYDTVVESFGLCSVADPAALVRAMADAVQPDSGRIILLEHGRGTARWINRILDGAARKHFARYGCWWNRDVEAIVRDAARDRPGLEVVRLVRPLNFMWGTTLLIEMKVNSNPQQQHQEAPQAQASASAPAPEKSAAIAAAAVATRSGVRESGKVSGKDISPPDKAS